ncbi:DNA polymerase III subunit beta [candidate division WWE3 bacterium RIFCSPHIGHO2_12_FULL_38_15]|uniref:Beta sliding clamp n=1 Tax=candidate division WWE3 bacterium RIFCSPHIGHO2_02_FULL_38_14 TaxID=1802620 RepID=A0A1F4V8A9_UNCKA|nr:MAG: DNA polymerase III subunit beta [candidate division WWE3 bacterium RIFCSPHIGHO2_01_FULL_38_45]OGC48683.1 MAG: DNA polymerase III subunit beta [candidate division WWE3 bacterium RIFCSPHIGHO2_12_FULL_38_15]OGC53089.1 MAG: DNA polymerase III subunit beta [candidate division WWE3 bacterium RIFCSPLOWO2_01_FULL_37_24]OGC53452.1 MAG: DNA polymerase III subunit beta [candidate division WWE3 bacterium RIFCSPHIGHO2_02_FULL_38_14]HLB51927.1 DNA polymerase III subunit beta [Patescibacteria group ba
MKFACLQENLAKGLTTIYRAVPTKSTLPILSNVLLIAEEGRLKLSATNLETAITTHVGAQTEEPGSTTVPAKLLRDFVLNLPPSTINATLKDDILNLTSEKTKSKINGVSSDDYPTLPAFGAELPYVELNPIAFSDAVSVVAFSASTDESRPVFTGVYLNLSEEKLTIAASDGFRLSEKIIDVKEGKLKNFTVIIPAKTILEVSKIFSGSEESIRFGLNEDENLALFKSEDTLIATRILDGQYPDYKRIIPTESELSVEFSPVELLEAVKLTTVFAKDNTSPIKISFDTKGTMKIGLTTQEIGEHQSEISAQVEGEPFEIAFNSKYLLDFLNNVKAERITLKSKGKLTPCLIKPTETEDFIHIIMPMQVQGS